MNLKTLSKRIPTNEESIFFKEIINEKGKKADKVFVIRYRYDYKIKQDEVKNIQKS